MPGIESGFHTREISNFVGNFCFNFANQFKIKIIFQVRDPQFSRMILLNEKLAL